MFVSIVIFSVLFGAAINSQQVYCQNELTDASDLSSVYSRFPIRSINRQPMTTVEQGHSEGIDRFPLTYQLELTQGHMLSRLPDERNFYEVKPVVGYEYLPSQRGLPAGLQWMSRGVGVNPRAYLSTGPKKMSLMNSEPAEGSNQDTPNDELAGQQQQQQAPSSSSDYTISTRSGQPRFPHSSKSFISSLLYGNRSPSSMPGSFGTNFNKKAEPKDNYFMHFGRK